MTATPTASRISCMDGLDWLRSWRHARPAMVYFDPPYGHGTFGDFDHQWTVDVLAEAWRVVADDGIVYLHADPILLWEIHSSIPLRGVIAWKNGWVSGFKSRSTKFWPRQYQVIAAFAKPNWRLRPVARPSSEYRSPGGMGGSRPDRQPNPRSFVYSDWWETPDPVDQQAWSKEKVGYPTQKPLALIERLIIGSTDEGDIVLDPCCGSGTTIQAALNVKREAYGADISGQACDVAAGRLTA